MLNEKQILEYAVKGITAEIEKLEKTVREGNALVKKIDNGEKVKATKTRFEIVEVIREKKAEIERLDKERFNLTWKLSVEMGDNNENDN